ncbi:hypothetical protein NZQ12_000962 [Salmonella enterica]|nr:hypothetical protein [Salmonella enterica]EKB8075516.1 hypothetical protein [Salmonella enterica]EKB8095198.1 hypothetical protein [Salmonella enterica]EKE0306531.1 hypothetical protein [Salmonella enterica]
MSVNNSNKNEKVNSYSWDRSYCAIFSEENKSNLEMLINIFYFLDESMTAIQEYSGEKTIPASWMKSLFEILTHRLIMINDDLFEPGGIFSQCDIVAGLKLARDKGVNGIQEIIDSLADK